MYENFDETGRSAEEFKARVLALADAYALNESFASDPEVFIKKFSSSGMADRMAENLTVGLKAYVWGGRSFQFHADRADGPLERLKQRRPWLTKILGPVKFVKHEFKIQEILPALNYRIPSGIGSTVTLNAQTEKDGMQAINIARVDPAELADMEFQLYAKLKPEDHALVGKLVDTFTIPG